MNIDDASLNDSSLDKSVNRLSYLGGDESSIDVQIDFASPKSISPDIRDPDKLKIRILQP